VHRPAEAVETDPLDTAGLIARCLAGDIDAERALYDRHARFVMSTARRLGTPVEEIEDVAQEVFTVAFRKLSRFHGGELTTWLYQICRMEVHHRHRSRRIRQAFARLFGGGIEPAELESQDGALSRHEAERRVSTILSRMSAKKREVFVLFEIEGLSGEEIAARVGCPLDTVWSRLVSARREFARIGHACEFIERSRSRA
jgi:RNA polymerase sigma-70 factor (ECF subfamily)